MSTQVTHKVLSRLRFSTGLTRGTTSSSEVLLSQQEKQVFSYPAAVEASHSSPVTHHCCYSQALHQCLIVFPLNCSLREAGWLDIWCQHTVFLSPPKAVTLTYDLFSLSTNFYFSFACCAVCLLFQHQGMNHSWFSD